MDALPLPRQPSRPPGAARPGRPVVDGCARGTGVQLGEDGRRRPAPSGFTRAAVAESAERPGREEGRPGPGVTGQTEEEAEEEDEEGEGE